MIACRDRRMRAWIVTSALAFLLAAAIGCATTPPPPPAPPVVSFETKMSWIIRLENERILRDQNVPVFPPPAAEGRRNVIAPPPPPPNLILLLGDEEARIRRRAALAIGRVGLADAVPSLVKVLQADLDAEVRQMAAFALGLIADRSAVEPLRAALADAAPLVAGRAAEALGLIGDADAAPAIGKLVAAHVGAAAKLSADESGSRLDAAADAFRLGVYALARLKAYEPLAASVLSPDGQARTQWWPVAYALQRVEDKRAVPALLALARSESSYTKAFAIKGLGALKAAAAVPLLLPLIDPARATSGPVIEAVRALGRIADERAAEPLVKFVYTRDLHPMARAEGLSALGETPGAVSPDAFVDFLGDRSPAVRIAALQALAKRDEETFLIVLSGLDPDSHWSVRAALATILGTKDPEKALPRLTPMLSDTDARVIPSVLAAMTKLKAPDMATILVEHLAKEDVGIRTAAATNIGELKPDRGADLLLGAYKRGEADLVIDTRAAAIEALSKYGAAVAVPVLRAALADKDWALRVKAAELLRTVDSTIETAHAMRPAPASKPVSYDSASLTTPSVSPHVYIETEKGTIEIELDVLDAPITSANFIELVGKGYFHGLMFHRVVPNFVIQGGDPRGDGEGGPGYTIRDELNQEPYLRGTVGMALAWRDTGGSQFFITHSPQPHLDARYTVFGRVVAGMEVVDAVAQGDVIKSVRVWDGVRQTINGR
jgi:cyclophilin family peptidyl-prolyl cis-trans isomerase/HEAT repeat protein